MDAWPARGHPAREQPLVSDALDVSVIIPVYQEGDRAGEMLDALSHRAGLIPHEVIVVDGDPEGSTLGMIADSRIVKLIACKGRASQMNSGALRARGDILLFLHADTKLPQGALHKILDALADKRFVGGAFDLGIDNPRRIFRLTGRCASLKHRLTRVPYGDQAIFLRKSYFESLGGYAAIPLMEDVELMKRIKRRGDRIVILPDAVATSSRKWEKDGILYTILRNWALQVLYLFGVPAEKLVKYYYK
ncbi:MAG: glycosyl transferase [Syntrophus sp. (in: bacteria)]|nr:glycosyl transferase [Syntrophus sp. (in: bacteria)]